MKVMILASGDLWAGAEVMLYHLVGGLVGIEGIKISVVLLSQGRLAVEFEKLGIEVHVVDESNYSFIALTCAVRKIVVGFSPDVIHSHRYKENLLACLVAFGHKNFKLVATQHGMPEMAGKGQNDASWLREKLFFRLLAFCFNRTVVVSREMQSALVGSHGFSEKNVKVIHNGVGIPQKIIPRLEERIVVGSAGRLFPVKNFSLLVDIVHHVVMKSNGIDFVLAGDGPERTLLEDMVRKYGIQDRFTFLGHVEDMDAFYRSLDVYINTSVHEGIPMSVLEAMSYNLPAVVPKVGGFPEIVEDGVSGFLIEGRDPVFFADKILVLMQKDHRRSIAEAARQRVIECFSRDAMARAYYRLYREMVDG